MAALPPPYAYCTLNDVRVHATIRWQDMDHEVGLLGGGSADIEQLIVDYSRQADTYLSKRRAVPLKVTPHRSISMYVARMVAAQMQEKRGELPESQAQDARASARIELQKFIEATVDPNGYVDVPEDNEIDGTSYTKPQTLSCSRTSPYPTRSF